VKWLYECVKGLPLAVWLALGAAFTVFALYLRGRRIEAELAHAKARLEGARATEEILKGRAEAATHYRAAEERAERVEELEAARALVRAAGAADQKRLAALPPDKVHDAYLEIAERKRLERSGASKLP
jgi:hypothetical protein